MSGVVTADTGGLLSSSGPGQDILLKAQQMKAECLNINLTFCGKFQQIYGTILMLVIMIQGCNIIAELFSNFEML